MMVTTSSTSYGFIGLGVMGYGMAHNLRSKISKTSPIHVCELNVGRRDQWIRENAGNVHVAETPAEIAQTCDVIFTMLPRGEHVYGVFNDKATGLLSVEPTSSRKLFIECSTIDVETSRAVGEAVTHSGVGDFADAPVSGGVHGANAGTLTFMVGASKPVFEIVRPLISLMGKPDSIFYCGEIGAGLATKQINNYMSAINMIGVCEGMNMGRLLGLDLKVLADVINTSTGMSRNSREQNPVKGISPVASSANDFRGGFSTELCVGVVEMAAQLGKQVKAKTVLGPAVCSFYQDAAKSAKCAGRDYRSIYELFAEATEDSVGS